MIASGAPKTLTLFENLLVPFYELIFNVSPELESISVNPNWNFRIKKVWITNQFGFSGLLETWIMPRELCEAILFMLLMLYILYFEN